VAQLCGAVVWRMNKVVDALGGVSFVVAGELHAADGASTGVGSPAEEGWLLTWRHIPPIIQVALSTNGCSLLEGSSAEGHVPSLSRAMPKRSNWLPAGILCSSGSVGVLGIVALHLVPVPASGKEGMAGLWRAWCSAASRQLARLAHSLLLEPVPASMFWQGVHISSPTGAQQGCATNVVVLNIPTASRTCPGVWQLRLGVTTRACSEHVYSTVGVLAAAARQPRPAKLT